MDLAIIGAGESSRLKAEGLKGSEHLIKIDGEYLIERIIRIAICAGVQKVHCIINSHEPELKNFLATKNFGVPLNLTVQDTQSSMHSLFSLAPYLLKEPFCLATIDTVFFKTEFSEFVGYSKMQEDADGVLAVTKIMDNKKPLCVAMDEEDAIYKFSNSKDGYSWATGGIYYFTPRIFDEMDSALKKEISGLRNFLYHLISCGYILKGFSFSKIINIDSTYDIVNAEVYYKGIE